MKNLWPGWEIVETIGSGGFGKVYKIRKTDDSTDEYVSALKIINIPSSPDDYTAYKEEGYDNNTITEIFSSQVQRIVDEFRLMSKLKGNSNIVSYEDHMIVPHENGIGWDILIRMELLTSLTKFNAENTMTPKDVAEMGIGICRALELCAKANIIHRDIKPQNIFVSDFGEYKLGDFGIAKTMDHATRATKTGTYTYMAPEVYRGEAYGPNIDIYSLGIVMYWALNEKRLPFLPLPPQAPTAAQIEAAQAKRLAGEPLPAPKNGSEQLKAIVLKACAFNPADRYQTPSEMYADLDAILHGISINIAPVPQTTTTATATIVTPTDDNLDKTVSLFGAKNAAQSTAQPKGTTIQPKAQPKPEDSDDKTMRISANVVPPVASPAAPATPVAPQTPQTPPSPPKPPVAPPTPPKKKIGSWLWIVLVLTTVLIAAIVAVLLLTNSDDDKSSKKSSKNTSSSEAVSSEPAYSDSSNSSEESSYYVGSSTADYPEDDSSEDDSSEDDSSEESSEAPIEGPKDAIEVTGKVISIGCEYEVPGGKGVIISGNEWPCSYNADLTDGVANPELAYDNSWFGFNDKPDDDGEANMFEGVGTVIIDLGEAKNVTGVKANIFTGGQDGIAPIGSIVVTVSTDGVTFSNPVRLNVPIGYALVDWAEGGFEAVSAQYVKVVFTKRGDGVFMFINEIEVYGEGGNDYIGNDDYIGDDDYDDSDYDNIYSTNVALGTSYDTEGYYSNGEWPCYYNASLTDGDAFPILSLYDNSWFAFCTSEGDNGINAPNGVGTVTFDLGSYYSLTSIRVHALAGDTILGTGINGPAKITAYVDGSYVGELTTTSSATDDGVWYELDVNAIGSTVTIEIIVDGLFCFINEVEVYS